MPNITTVSGTITIEASKTTVLELLTYLNNAYSCTWGISDYDTTLFIYNAQFVEVSKTQIKITVPFAASGKGVYTNNLEWFKTDFEAPISDKYTGRCRDILAQTALDIFKKGRGDATIKFAYNEYDPDWNDVMVQGNAEFVFQAGKLINVTMSTSDGKANAHNLIEAGLYEEPVDADDYETIVNVLVTEYFDSSDITEAQKQKLIARLKTLTTKSLFIDHENVAIAIENAAELSLLELEAEIQ